MDTSQRNKIEESADLFRKKTSELCVEVEAYLRELKIAQLKYGLNKLDDSKPVNATGVLYRERAPTPTPDIEKENPAAREIFPAESASVEAEKTPEALVEQSIENAEKNGVRTMEMLTEIGNIEKSANPGEISFLEDYMIRNPVTPSLSERITGFFHTHEELQEQLTHAGNPRMVQLAQRAGKVTGGIAGFLAGSTGGPLLGSVMGAVGSKLGANAALRLYERFGVPGTNREAISVLETSKKEKGERNANEIEEIKTMVEEIKLLSPEQQRMAGTELASDPEIAGTMEQIEADQERIASLYEHIEKKWPLAGMALEVGVEFGADVVLHNYHLLAEAGLLIAGIVGAAGATEVLTKRLIDAAHRMHVTAQKGIHRISQVLDGPALKEDLQTVA